MPTFMKMICAAAMVAAAQGKPVLDADEVLDGRMAQLAAKVNALDLASDVSGWAPGADVPDSIVKAYTGGKFESCG